MCALLRTLAAVLLPAVASAQEFVHWESPHVHPLDMNLDGSRLLAVNTPGAHLEVFDPTGPRLVHVASVPVGLDPVSVRARGITEAWVVNHVSDSISIVDLVTGRVVRTLATLDEPCDVVFAGSPQRAFVSCSQANAVLVFDPANLDEPPVELPIAGEDPRALAVSLDGQRVYAAVFESGNGTTLLGGGLVGFGDGAYPPNAVNDPAGPYGGVNPPPNTEAGFDPPLNPALPPPPPVGLIVRKDEQERWLDDNGENWTDLVSGAGAPLSGRVPGWDLPDRDVALIDASTLEITYARRLMNLNMALGVHPTTGHVAVIGTDATNEVRFEPNLAGRFVRVVIATVDGTTGEAELHDLNPHLDYASSSVPPALREQSLGDPRGIAWSADGERGYVTGMGSNNVIVVNLAGERVSQKATIEVGEGPTGVVVDDLRDRLYVLDKFESAVSVVHTGAELETDRVAFHDPSPPAVRAGRPLLYDTHATSGTGHLSCGSCHVDARMDRLAWDLGNPAGDMKSVAGQNQGAGTGLVPGEFADFHPMKGPFLTQTLQDIVGKEPFHWRGDRDGLEEFAGAFVGLLGDDEEPTPQELQAFEDFLATIAYPPNPYREWDNSLPTDLPLPGHFTTGRFAPAGQPLPNGDAARGLELWRPPNLLNGGVTACVTCHTLPTGMGPDMQWDGAAYVPLAPGPHGETHHMLVASDGHSNVSMRVASLRNLHERTGFNGTQLENTAGFGYVHDGSVDSIERQVSQPPFSVHGDQQVADLVAFVLAFAGSDLPQGSADDVLEPPGTPARDTHASVGTQLTVVSAAFTTPEEQLVLDRLITLANAGELGLIAKGRVDGEARGYVYLGGGAWHADRTAEVLNTFQMQALAEPGGELTYTAVPFESRLRLGVDRDGDGHLDADELDAVADPDDAASVPGDCAPFVPDAPTDLAVRHTGWRRLLLTWKDAGPHETHYLVERALSGSGAFELVARLPADTRSFTDIGLDCGAAHDYRVRAANCQGSSAAELTATPDPCQPFSATTGSLSLATGGVQLLTLAAGPEHAGRPYLIAGSATGTAPGIPFDGEHFPLNFDKYFLISLAAPNTPPLTKSLGFLDAAGNAQALISLEAGTDPSLAGPTLHHAYVVFDLVHLGPYLISNPLALTLLP